MSIEARLFAIRDAIQHDVGARGLARDPKANLINAFPDDFLDACRSIAEHPRPTVGVVTGFWIPSAKMGETDGPLGAVYLWRTLRQLDIPVYLVSDPFCTHALREGLRAAHTTFGPSAVLTLADKSGPQGLGWLTHLIALERVGPSHTPISIGAQPDSTTETIAAFCAEVPEKHHDRCHTMRAIDITDQMRPAAWLFESPARPPVTIGIGDGGNEIGMGKISWDVIRRNIPGGSHIACRVPTDHLIVAGISNWGAYALAAGIALLRGFAPPKDWFDLRYEEALLSFMVENGPLVDGVTGLASPRVDGLPFEEYGKVLERIGDIVRESSWWMQ